MNEEQLANALAEQLDALLAGDSSASAPPDEVSDLLDLSEELGGLTPAPRPEFATALKASVLAAQSGGAAGSATLLASPWVISGLALALIAAGTALVAVLLWGQNQAEPPVTATPVQITAPALQPELETEPAATVSAPATATPKPDVTQTSSTADSLPTAAPTVAPTALLDVLPPITVTVEVDSGNGVEVSPPGGLVPGQSGSGGGDDGSRGSGHGEHGEDDDDHHHDDD